MIVYKYRRKDRDNLGYAYGTTTDERDSAMVMLLFRPRSEATMVHPGNFKQIKTSVVTPGSLQFFRVITDHDECI